MASTGPKVSVEARGDDVLQRWSHVHEMFARRMMGLLRAAEGRGASLETRGIEERLVQAVWHDQLLRPGQLVTSSGKQVEVVEPGRWNTGPGPDFLDARVRVAGAELAGDVEIHVRSGDWAVHRHDRDFAYNRVVLHVVLEASDDRPFDEKHNGERLERLPILHAIEPDLETLRRSINLDDYPYGKPEDVGLCHTEFLRLPVEQLVDFFAVAGRARIEERIRRFDAQLSGARDFRQLLHQSLLVAQGHRSNKTLYFLLGRRAPFDEVLGLAQDVGPGDRHEFFLSVLLHVAAILPVAGAGEEADAETSEFLRRLGEHWRLARPYFADRLIPPTKRWHAGVRPAGFPGRRLAAVSILAGRMASQESPLFDEFCRRVRGAEVAAMSPRDQRAWWRTLCEPLVVEDGSHYFARHFTIGGKEQKPQALMGEPSARSLVFNTLLPIAALRGRRQGDATLERAAWEHLVRFPALDENAVARFMKRRLLGETDPPAGLLSLELGQQALLKVFADCCAHNERSCDDCTFLALGRKLMME